jgi:hypothetical protein
MRRGLVWAGVILAATALDLGARFAPGLDFEAALWIEVAVFVGTAFVLYRLYREDPASPGWRQGLQVVLVASFVLGALRSAIWVSGSSVTAANTIILGLGVTAWLVWRYRRRAKHAPGADSRHASSHPPEETTGES